MEAILRGQHFEGPDAPDYIKGAALIRSYVERLTTSPGVYRMLDRDGAVLYVGKARNLKNRVSSYARASGHNDRISRMIAQTASMMFITTKTDTEALLLEQNLIKQLKPRYNVLLRDDKAFPEILVREDHDFPQILRHRGAHKRKGRYFGPFASGGAVTRTLHHLERAFLLRTCSDSDFGTRSRPCLQYQIKRCSAPCVGKIAREDYLKSVGEAVAFMEGRSHEVQRRIAEEMSAAAEALNYEKAATLRDRLAALSTIQSNQNVNPGGVEAADVIAIANEGGVFAIQIFFIRSHQNWGNHAFFPKLGANDDFAAILEAFIGQFYARRIPPPLLIVSEMPQNHDLLEDMLGAKAGRSVSIMQPKRGEKYALMGEALRNAREAAARRLAAQSAQDELLAGLADRFGLAAPPQRIEIFDNSHIQGAHAVGAMVVAGPEGWIKSHYRKYNIKSEELTPGDDFAMMEEVLSRRFKRLIGEDGPDASGSQSQSNTGGHDAGGHDESTPDLVLIDGGKGQLSRAHLVMEHLGVDIPTIAIAKGEARDAGRELFHMKGRAPLALAKNDPVLHFIQRLRDEAHRFAIGTHRKRRSSAIGRNALDDVPGIGASRKRALLLHFGSARAVRDASVTDLCAVGGISKAMAENIYGYFHPDGA